MTTLPFHNIVTLKGLHFNDCEVTMNLPTTVTKADEGKALTLDTSGANKAKLAGDGDYIIGRLEVVEVRSSSQVVGTVALDFANTLPVKSGETIAVGDTVVGAGNGEVKAKTSGTPAVSAPDYNANYVVEVIGSTHVVVVKC